MGPDNGECMGCGRSPSPHKYDGTSTQWMEELEIASGCVAAHPHQMGGQHVAKPCTGVLVVHKPTGIAVRVDTERSQFGNREKAVEKLRNILYLIETSIRTLEKL